MSQIISLLSKLYNLPVEVLDAIRSLLRRPKAMLMLLQISPPLPKEHLNDPDLIYIYPAAFIQWSRCMHGLAAWEGSPVLRYGEYVAQMEILLGPTDVALRDRPQP